MITVYSTLRRLRSLLPLALLATSLATAWAQTESTGVGGGTLSWTVAYSSGRCGEEGDNSYQSWSFSAFEFAYGGSTYSVSGGGVYFNSPGTSAGCPPSGAQPTVLPISLPSNVDNGCVVDFTPESGGSGYATLTNNCPVQSLTGYVDPKYVVVGVTYAPPGPASFVQYQASTTVGTTKSLSNSFTGSNTSSVSLTYSGGIPGFFSGSETGSYSATNSQLSKSTSTVTTSIQVQSGEKTFGTGNYYAPVDNDYDVIWIWLNPVSAFTLTGSSIVWNGYGYDENDQNGLDIVGIELGYLNGHFGAMPPQYATAIARAWAAKQLFASGQGPGLTSSDLAQIAAADPFSVSSYATSEIGYVPPSPETGDHRFTMSACTSAQSFDYDQASPSQPAEVYTCTLTYTNTSTQAQEITNTFAQTFSVDKSFSGGPFWAKFSLDLKSAYTLTWVTDEQSTITNTNASTAALSVQGPTCNNVTQGVGPCVPVYDASGNEPTQFDVYQDNMYGTFMFAPIHYF